MGAGRGGWGAGGQRECSTDPLMPLDGFLLFLCTHSPCPMAQLPAGSNCGSFWGSHPPGTGAEFMTLCLGLDSSESLQDGAAATLAGRQTLWRPLSSPCSPHSLTGFLRKISFTHRLYPGPHFRGCS